jgi:hypothetical protein
MHEALKIIFFKKRKKDVKEGGKEKRREGRKEGPKAERERRGH